MTNMDPVAYITETKSTNDRLGLLYGRNVNVDKNNFRLIQNRDCIEKRAGELHYGNVFLKEDVKIIKKYPWRDEGDWVVERLVPNVLKDVIEGEYSYEPIYFFNIYPTWKAVEFLLDSLFRPQVKQPKTQLQAEYEERERLRKAKISARDMIDVTVLGTALADKNAQSFANAKGIDYRPSKQGEE